MPTGYEIYCEWCREHNRVPPTKAWWDKTCQVERRQWPRDLDDLEIEREAREGWHDFNQ